MSDVATESATRYVPGDVEAKWLNEWEKRGAFKASVDDAREAYTIVVPPPNVTGALHMGHALNGSIQDCLIRWKRMQGYNALWLPGVDHAGIATQAVVERELRKEGTTRQELGRAAFLERVQQWKDEYAETIYGQFKSLGASMDFSRSRFTMDDAYANAVTTAFIKLYEAGYVYRAHRLVNWDAGTMSAISDLEVKQIEVEDELVEVAYPLVDEAGVLTGAEIVIATARPETIVADVAIAVHPDDERYKSMVGALVKVPFTERKVPIIADDYVDREFGTGALKITPGHDPNDFAIGRRHGLEEISAINPDRTMSSLAGEYAGMDVDQARSVMTDRLEELGLLRGREPYRHQVPHSDRSGVRIEPLISLQWFADMTELAKPALEWVKQGDIRFIPDGSKSIFYSWMEDLQPWCLSRQLWWGHQLPVWYCSSDESHVHVSADGPQGVACPECGSTEWTRDEDVLDTWFSSAMWDHATLGWPEKTPELEHFHPTAVLCTARDIINLWVARMMMFSYQHLNEVPFHDVYIHSTIQAPDGRRMSKSLGTGIDPLELFAKYGADATRYGLLDMSSTQDVRFNEGRIREGRDLANKLWNAVRLLTGVGGRPATDAVDAFIPEEATLLEDRWILMRLDRVLQNVHKALTDYEFAQATKSIYHFCWNELCDWYLESIKERLRSNDERVRQQVTVTLAWVLDATIRMIHPIMPHLSEELSVQLWGDHADSEYLVATADWPTGVFAEKAPDVFADSESQYERLQALITRLRSLRQSADVKPSVTISARMEAQEHDGNVSFNWEDSADLFRILANIDLAGATTDSVISLPVDGALLNLYGLDTSVLKERLQAELKTARAELKRAEGKLKNERFTAKAPEALVAEERAKVERFQHESAHLEAVISQL